MTVPSAAVPESSSQLLFIDSEESSLRYAQRILAPMGYEVVTSLDWKQAKDLLQQTDVRPKIIFVEPIPGENQELATLQEICSEASQIPVIALSVSRDPETIVAAIRAGARAYVNKPFETEDLRLIITSVLGDEMDSCPPAVKPLDRTPQLIFSSARMKQIHETAWAGVVHYWNGRQVWAHQETRLTVDEELVRLDQRGRLLK